MPRKAKHLYSVAEFFCGCGGFSNGFERTGRFRIVFGNDIKEFARYTFEKNHTTEDFKPVVLPDDIRLISDSTIIKALESQGVAELDCLLGGPPCQGFSQMRRTEERKGSKIVKFGGYNRLDQDPRNDLVLRFLEVAAAINPKVIVLENVPQFLSHYHDGKAGGIAQQVEDVLGELGYEHIDCDILNAADYGVPQLRQRAFIIASRVGRIPLPMPTHGDRELFSEWKGQTWFTVSDALADLPDKPPLRDELGGSENGYVSDPHSALAKTLRTSPTFPFNHITRKYEPRIINIIREMQPGETWDDASARMQKRFESFIESAVANGESADMARKRLEEEGRILPVFYKRYYWSAYTRLAWDRPALTITANSNFLGSGRFTHPTEDRGITMREAARLQTFDDAFTFYTSTDPERVTENIGVGLDMIGEAVPPALAKVIAEAVVLHLDKLEVDDD